MHYCDRRLSIGNDDNNEMSSRKFIYLAIEWNSKKIQKNFCHMKNIWLKQTVHIFFKKAAQFIHCGMKKRIQTEKRLNARTQQSTTIWFGHTDIK